ncbi:MAG: DUF2339 domain-containing protein, partial [Gammaproteobacteria bacterium]|nr:DUF2339 domain-containing protein [Gammaproteobacteria bacterium]
MWWTGVILGFFFGLIISQGFAGALLFAIIGGFVGFAISQSQARKRGQIEPGAKGSPYFSAPESEPERREQKSLQSQFLDLQGEMKNMQRRMVELERQLFDSVSASESEKRAEPARPEKAAAYAAKTMPPAAKIARAVPSEKKTEAPIPNVPPPSAVPPASTVPPGSSVPPRSTLPPRPTAVQKPVKPPKRPTPPAHPSPLRDFIRRFVIGGNPLVKIGVLILFLGLGFALRYAADYGLLPLWFRYVGVAAVGVAMLVFGWRWRGREDNYGLIMQGGGVGVLYLTTLAAMKLHPLLPMGFGFAILVVVAAFAAFLAVMQDAVILAVVAALGGFAAPVLASTGSGNHIALFSYLTVLNLGIVGIAWFKSWRVLNIIGYVCSFGLGTTWAVQYYRDELFWTTEPFLLLLFGLYVLITLLFARRSLADAPDDSGESLGAQVRQASKQLKYVDGSLAFGVPFSAFWVQHLLVEPYQYGAAISAAGFGAFYFLLAYLLSKRTSKRYALLTETLVALGAVFSTLAIPLLETPWTAAAYAVEAAGVYWIGIRQRQMHVRVFALLVLVGSAIYFLPELGFSASGAVLDGPVLSAVLLTVSTGFTYWLMWRTKPDQLHVYETELRPYVVGFGGLMLATIPMLLFRLEWASPTLSILGAALIFASMHMSDRFVLRAGLILQFVGGALFLTTLDNGTGVAVLDGSLVG